MNNHLWLRETLRGLLAIVVVGAVALLVISSVHAIAITDSLMARYEFNESSGTVVRDYSGNNNIGNIIGSPTWGTGVGCLTGGCLNFTGSGQRVTVASSSTVQGLYNFSVLGWVKFNTVGIVQTIIAKDNASSQQTFDVYLNGANGWNFNYWDTSGVLGDILSDPPGGVNTTQGICFAMTRDVSLGINNFKSYFNGVMKDQATKTNNQMALSPATNFTIGQRGDNGQQVNASISRIWIFNRTISTTEMATLCAAATVDTTPPIVNMTSPTNTTYGTTSVWVNATLNEDTGNVTAQLDSGTNYSLANSSGNWNYQLTSLGQGAHNVRVFANDSNGNMNSSQIVYFTVDTGAPGINILSPANITYNSTTANITLNVTSNKTINTWMYSLNGAANVTFVPNITFTARSGGNSITITANDTSGNRGFNTSYFTVNTSIATNITLYDEVTEASVIGTGKFAVVTLRYSNTYAANTSYNATNGTVLFWDVNNSAWIVDAGSTGSDFPFSRTTILNAGQLTANVYLIPSGADAVYVTFSLNDPTGTFTGALVKLKKYINNSLVELSRVNFDAANNAPFYLLRNNKYQIFINTSTEERNLGWYIPTAAGTQSIYINNASISPTVTSSGKDVFIGVNYTNASNYSGTIGFAYQDRLNKTNGLEFWVYNGTNESDQLYYTSANASTFYATYGGITNTNITYLTKWRVNHSVYGQIEGRQLISMFNMALRVGLGSAFTARWHYLLVSLLVIIFTAGIFTARTSGVGGALIMGEILLFSWFGWIQVSGLVVSLLGLLVIIGILTKRGGI